LLFIRPIALPSDGRAAFVLGAVAGATYRRVSERVFPGEQGEISMCVVLEVSDSPAHERRVTNLYGDADNNNARYVFFLSLGNNLAE
jgi:hypothetical protein